MSVRKSRSTSRQALNFERLEPKKVLASIVPIDATVIAGRYVFYNDSAYDSVSDSNAIATDKVALLGGETASYENITNFSEGINGIIIDADLTNPAAFSASDIELSTGTAATNFTSLNVTPTVSVGIGQGEGGTDRITITLPNRSVVNEYLQVTVLANSNTGLAADDVFYFGNVVGETGNTAANTRVDASDLGGVQSNLTAFTLTDIEDQYDFNKDRRVDATDLGLIQSNLTAFSTLPFITTAAAPTAPPTTTPLLGAEFFVSSSSELNSVLNQVSPGDTITLRDGTYTNQHFQFSADGTQSLPITFRAETPGQVILNGSSRLSISGDWLVVDGLNFDGGALNSGNVVEFRGNNGDATNSRFTNSAITNYNPSNESTRYFWVSIYGQNNRVDHNTFSGQNHSGVTVTVWRSDSSPDFHRIDNNHFLDRPVSTTGDNGFETIRIGTSQQSLSDSFTIVENNLFEAQDGEIEIISVKSGSNIIRNNTFLESAGTLTLRHGNNSVVEGNYFIGNGTDRSGGVRIIGEGHTIVNNYFEGLDGRAGGAISISAGVDGPLNAHAQVRDLLIANNTIVNLNDGAAIFFTEGFGNNNGAGDRELLAQNVTIANNLISTSGEFLFQGFEGSGFVYESNIAVGQSLGTVDPDPGLITNVNPQLLRGTDGVLRLTSNSPAIDAAFAAFASATGGVDIDGQARGSSFDIGADEFSAAAFVQGPLTANDVGNCFHDAVGVTPPPVAPPANPGDNPVVSPAAPPLGAPQPTGNSGFITDGLIVQANEYTSTTDPNGDGDTFTISYDGTASNEAVLLAPFGDRVDLDAGDAQDAVVTYELQFAEAGNYTAYYRATGNSSSTDSFFTPTDFGVNPDVRENISNSGFQWERGATFNVSSADVNSSVDFNLGKREALATLDVIVFHLDSNLSDAELDAFFPTII